METIMSMVEELSRLSDRIRIKIKDRKVSIFTQKIDLAGIKHYINTNGLPSIKYKIKPLYFFEYWFKYFCKIKEITQTSSCLYKYFGRYRKFDLQIDKIGESYIKAAIEEQREYEERKKNKV